jgi:hypothetical protein
MITVAAELNDGRDGRSKPSRGDGGEVRRLETLGEDWVIAGPAVVILPLPDWRCSASTSSTSSCCC